MAMRVGEGLTTCRDLDYLDLGQLEQSAHEC